MPSASVFPAGPSSDGMMCRRCLGEGVDSGVMGSWRVLVQVALLRFTGYKIINNISDTGKAFLIILITDIFLG